MVDGRETVGNSLELRWEGARWERRQGGRTGNRAKYLGDSSVGRERDGSDDRVDGRETVGNSLGTAPL